MVFVVSDAKGKPLGQEINSWCKEWGIQVVDLSNQNFSWQQLSDLLCKQVSLHLEESVGIMISSDGVEPTILANRNEKIRCCLAMIPDQVKKARQNLDVNVLALAADYTSFKRAKKIVSLFFKVS